LGNAGYTIAGTSGSNVTGLNFADFVKFNISGTKFQDSNGDGLTVGDSGQGGITIFLDTTGNSVLDSGDLSTVTASDGSWSFSGLGTGHAGQMVPVSLPAALPVSLGNAGYTIAGTSGHNQTGLNFADFPSISISGTKFQDSNGDGLTVG